MDGQEEIKPPDMFGGFCILKPLREYPRRHKIAGIHVKFSPQFFWGKSSNGIGVSDGFFCDLKKRAYRVEFMLLPFHVTQPLGAST